MTPDETLALKLVNEARTVHGLKPVKRAGLLTLLARRHSKKMARQGDLFHNDLGAQLLDAHTRWSYWGQNVGVAPAGEVKGLHYAFMRSTDHRANILGRFRLAGIGIHQREGLMWMTANFLR